MLTLIYSRGLTFIEGRLYIYQGQGGDDDDDYDESALIVMSCRSLDY